MSKLFTYFCASCCAYSAIALADAPMDTFAEAPPEFPMMQTIQMPIEEVAPALVIEAPVVVMEPKVAPKKVAEKVQEVNVNPFTGKVKGRKVRMRLRPDLDSRIIKELSKNELVTITGEKGEFWAVQAPATTKAYIFRSFVLDNVVEGTRVNIRLEPSLDAPIIAHMNSGDRVEDPSVSPINPKWLEFTPPSSTRFYVAKEYIEYAGGPEVKAVMDSKQASAEQLLDASSLLSKTELRKPFSEIDFDRVVKGYNTVIVDFSEFPELVEQAKEALASFQEAYLHKRISHMETEHYAALQEQKKAPEEIQQPKQDPLTDKMKLWEPIEEALYLSWANINDNKDNSNYEEEQRLASIEITGIVEPYVSPVKAKPGDFILRDKDLPVGYIYSTRVNLQNLVGKQVTMVAVPRPNNNFAFPAYYILSAEN